MVPRVLVPVVETATVPAVPKDAMGARHTTTVSTRQRLAVQFQCTLGIELQAQSLRTRLPCCPIQKCRGKTGHRPKAVRYWFPVKTVARPSLRSGAEMSLVILFATLAVCSPSFSVINICELTETGLYYKLHGCYRPTTMKKTIIKRRKRVVPALRDQSPTAATQSSNGSSASPEASPAGLAHGQDDYRYLSTEPVDHYPPMSTGRVSPRPFTFAPPPVDFTSYSSGTVSLPHHPPPPRLLEPERMGVSGHSPASSQFDRRSVSPNPSGNPKKRTLAESSVDSASVPTTLESGSNQLPPIMSSVNPSPPTRLSSISSLLNHADKRQEDPPAPIGRQQHPHPYPQHQPHQPHQHHHQHHPPPPQAAPLANPPPPQQPLPGVNELDGYMSERRIKLQREAEEMREILRAKERELAELGQ